MEGSAQQPQAFSLLDQVGALKPFPTLWAQQPQDGASGRAGVIDAAMAMESAVQDELSYAPEKVEEAEERVRQEDAAAQTAEPEQAQAEQAEEQAAEYWVQCESCKK